MASTINIIHTYMSRKQYFWTFSNILVISCNEYSRKFLKVQELSTQLNTSYSVYPSTSFGGLSFFLGAPLLKQFPIPWFSHYFLPQSSFYFFNRMSQRHICAFFAIICVFTGFLVKNVSFTLPRAFYCVVQAFSTLLAIHFCNLFALRFTNPWVILQ